MRPIDADKLKEHYSWWNEADNEDYKKFKKIFDGIIDEQPTLNTKEDVTFKEMAVGDKCYAIYVTIQYEYTSKPYMRGVYSVSLLNLYAWWQATGKNNTKLYPQEHSFVKSDFVRLGKFVFRTKEEAQAAIDKVVKIMREGKE